MRAQQHIVGRMRSERRDLVVPRTSDNRDFMIPKMRGGSTGRQVVTIDYVAALLQCAARRPSDRRLGNSDRGWKLRLPCATRAEKVFSREVEGRVELSAQVTERREGSVDLRHLRCHDRRR